MSLHRRLIGRLATKSQYNFVASPPISVASPPHFVASFSDFLRVIDVFSFLYKKRSNFFVPKLSIVMRVACAQITLTRNAWLWVTLAWHRLSHHKKNFARLRANKNEVRYRSQISLIQFKPPKAQRNENTEPTPYQINLHKCRG